MCRSSRRARYISTVSLTGISSAVVTRFTAVRAGSVSRSTSRCASRCTSPVPNVSRAAAGMRRYCRLWPVAGASTMTRSQRRPPLCVVGALGLVPDLADRHQLLQARRRGDEVLVERLLNTACSSRFTGMIRPRYSASAALPSTAITATPGRVVTAWPSAPGSASSSCGARASAVDLAEQHLAPAPRRLERQRAGDRRLADAALADDDEQAAL